MRTLVSLRYIAHDKYKQTKQLKNWNSHHLARGGLEYDVTQKVWKYEIMTGINGIFVFAFNFFVSKKSISWCVLQEIKQEKGRKTD